MVGASKTSGRRNTVWATVLHAALLLLPVSVGFVDSAAARVPHQNSPDLSVSYARQFAIADFDGDNRPDLASVEFGRNGPLNYSINLRLTSGPQQSINIAAPEGGLQLRAQDVNGDSFPDVVVTTFWTDRPVAILLNDGRGNFTRSEPSAFPGAFQKPENSLTTPNDNKADSVAALLSRYSPEPWEEKAGAAPPLTVVGRFAGENLGILVSPTGNSPFGRAPPSTPVHF